MKYTKVVSFPTFILTASNGILGPGNEAMHKMCWMHPLSLGFSGDSVDSSPPDNPVT